MNRERINYLENMEEKVMSQVKYLRDGEINGAMSCMVELNLLLSNSTVVDCDCKWTQADNNIAPSAEICVHCYTIRIQI